MCLLADGSGSGETYRQCPRCLRCLRFVEFLSHGVGPFGEFLGGRFVFLEVADCGVGVSEAVDGEGDLGEVH